MQHLRDGQETRRGFTLIELLVVITIIGILAAIALPNYIRAKDKAKEVQLKASVKALQVAIERYHVDFEEYPLFLLGGDVEGWKNWHFKFDEANPAVGQPANAWVKDPLVEFGYMDSYPRNPFVDNGQSVIQQTGPVTVPAAGYQPGDGDPRFGFRGDVMGNGLENPMIFHNWYTDAQQNIETERTLLTSTGGNPAAKGFGTRTATGGANNSGGKGLHYAMGGRRGVKMENGQQVIYTAFIHWPGNFFYRGFPERNIGLRKGWTVWFPQAFVKAETNRYILGGYGSFQTEGVDVAHLEEYSASGDEVFYRLPPPWSGDEELLRLAYVGVGFDGGMPEIAGGGNDTQGPWLPPDRSPDYPGAFIYGAPDGHPDAAIIILTPGEEVQAYQQ